MKICLLEVETHHCFTEGLVLLVHQHMNSALPLCSLHHLSVSLQVDRQLQHLRSRLDQLSPQHSDAAVLAEQVR